MKIRFVGEGPSDVGWDEHAGVVQIFTRKLLARRLGSPPVMETESERLPHLRKAHGYAAKARIAITEAHRLGFDGVAIVVDQDRRHERLRLLREGRDTAATTVPLPAAVGVAIETLEAWLLADESAIGRALRLDTPPQAGPDPESLDGPPRSDQHPKVRLAIMLARDRIEGRRNQERLEAIATETDVGVVERRCTKGFGKYADEVVARLAPIFASTPTTTRIPTRSP